MYEEIVKTLKEIGIIEQRKSTGVSGIPLEFYVDFKKAYSNPELISIISKELISKIPYGTTCVAVTGHGGLALGGVISVIARIKLSMIRKDKKDHGLAKLIDGYIPSNNDKVFVVDDVFTTGKSIRTMHEVLSKTGASIIGNFVIVKRSENSIPPTWGYLIDVKDLL